MEGVDCWVGGGFDNGDFFLIGMCFDQLGAGEWVQSTNIRRCNGVGIEGFHCIQRGHHSRGLE